ncbi:hypothetical protein [Devosia sp.]|uniref:hypothetical protein n=1 Tax=Devosia sp. TaxID=1871048 RepID=UPI002609D770|nr:hypothetical protein [Devosia sp.]
MFLVRSVFWLLVAYMVIRPGMDFDPHAAANQAVAAGQQLVSEQVDSIQCDSLQCFGGKAVLASVLPSLPDTTPVGPTMQEQPTAKDVPYPMPRLRRAG